MLNAFDGDLYSYTKLYIQNYTVHVVYFMCMWYTFTWDMSMCVIVHCMCMCTLLHVNMCMCVCVHCMCMCTLVHLA